MTSSSSLFRARMALMAAALLFALIVVSELFRDQRHPESLAMAAGGLVASLLGVAMVLRLRARLAAAVSTMRAVARGDFEARLIPIHEGGLTGELLHSINELIELGNRVSHEFQSLGVVFVFLIMLGLLVFMYQLGRIAFVLENPPACTTSTRR